MSEECPECGAELEHDEVDIGVGVQQGAPWCPECGWSSNDELDGDEGNGFDDEDEDDEDDSPW